MALGPLLQGLVILRRAMPVGFDGGLAVARELGLPVPLALLRLGDGILLMFFVVFSFR
jgi:hypothetical protein